MKINKKILKQIIKEELGAMQEFGNPGPSADQAQPEAPEDPIQGRVQSALNKWTAGESILKTIDDPKEVVPFVVGVLEHLRTLNPDFSPSELIRVIELLRTRVLPDMKKGIQ